MTRSKDSKKKKWTRIAGCEKGCANCYYLTCDGDCVKFRRRKREDARLVEDKKEE